MGCRGSTSGSGSGPADQFKIFFVGDACVGKTIVIDKLTKAIRHSTNYRQTYGYHSIDWEFLYGPSPNSSKVVQFQLYDTAGQEKHRHITKHHYKKGIGAVIVYDITREDSFCNVKNWIEEIKSHCMLGEEQPLILVLGNKRDLSAQRQVGHDEAKALIAKEDKDILFTEITALDPIDSEQIQKIFHIFFTKICQKLARAGYISDPYNPSPIGRSPISERRLSNSGGGHH